MKKLLIAFFILSNAYLPFSHAEGILKLDESAITMLAKDKDIAETKTALMKTMQGHGYKIDKSAGEVLEFRRKIKGLLGILSAGEKLQQEDVVNCLLIKEDDDTLISCRAYVESVNRKGIEKRLEKTQALGYRKKLTKELSVVN